MEELLQQIRDLTPSQNPFLGDQRTLQLRQRVADFPPGMPALQRVRYHSKLGRDELRLGTPTAAITQYQAGMALIPQLPAAQRRVVRNMLAYYLGVANLRWGENLNCVARHTPESCLLPIRGSGVHTDPTGSRTAIGHFTVVLENTASDAEEHLASKWLLNIAYMTIGEYPQGVPERYLLDPSVFVSGEEFPRFVNVATELGLDDFDMCGGAIADDFDGDGDFDLIASTWDPAGGMHYYRNDGRGGFEKLTEQAGLGQIVGGLNLTHADGRQLR
jgi:hypothetical protein